MDLLLRRRRVGQLEAPESATKFHGWRRRLRRHTLALIWGEKVWLLLDWLQGFALLWALSQPWPWPPIWLKWTRWTVAFNADALSLSARGAAMGATGESFAVWGELDGYVNSHVLAFSALAYAILGALAPSQWRQRHLRNCHAQPIAVLRALALALAQGAYLPVGLALSRLLNCTESAAGSTLTVDPRVACGSATHVVALVVHGPSLVAMMGCVPYVVGAHIVEQIAYEHHLDHEKLLQRVEIESALKLHGGVRHAWLLLPFRRRAAFHRFHVLAEKFALLCTFALARNWEVAQAMIFWAIVLRFTFLLGLRPFRSWTSNGIFLTLRAATLVNATFGMLTAYRIQSALLVASTQTLLLASVNGVAFLGALGFALASVLTGEAGRAQRTLEQMCAGSPHRLDVPAVVEAVKRARGVVEAAESVLSPTMAPMHLIEEQMRILQRHWLDAKSCDSLLEGTLREGLEELCHTHQRYSPCSLLPGNGLADALGASGKLVGRRHAQTLMSQRKRSVLLKLMSLRLFLVSAESGLASRSARKSSFVHVDTGEDEAARALLADEEGVAAEKDSDSSDREDAASEPALGDE